MKNSLAPIVLFVYNRLSHTHQTVEALNKNVLAPQSDLYIFADGAKNDAGKEKVQEVRSYLKGVSGFKSIEIINRPINYGLAQNIIFGVTDVFTRHDKVIVVEDDLITSPYFLKYMNECLDLYEKKVDIFSITGFSFTYNFMGFKKIYWDDKVYANIRPMSWGWGTWKNRWEEVNWNLSASAISEKEDIKKFNTGGTGLTPMLRMQISCKVDSWYVRFCYHAIMNDKLTVYPVKSLINNIGHDATGRHCVTDKSGVYSHKELCLDDDFCLPEHPILDKRLVKRFNRAFNVNHTANVYHATRRFIKKYLMRLIGVLNG